MLFFVLEWSKNKMMGSTRLIKLVFDISDIKENFETEREERLRVYSGWIFRSKMSAAATEKGFEKPWQTKVLFIRRGRGNT